MQGNKQKNFSYDKIKVACFVSLLGMGGTIDVDVPGQRRLKTHSTWDVPDWKDGTGQRRMRVPLPNEKKKFFAPCMERGRNKMNGEQGEALHVFPLFCIYF